MLSYVMLGRDPSLGSTTITTRHGVVPYIQGGVLLSKLNEMCKFARLLPKTCFEIEKNSGAARSKDVVCNYTTVT